MTGCPQCGGPGSLIGALGTRDHYRCRDCGWDYSVAIHNVRVFAPLRPCENCGVLHDEDYCPRCEEFS